MIENERNAFGNTKPVPMDSSRRAPWGLVPNLVDKIQPSAIFGLRKTTAGAGGIKAEGIDLVLGNDKSLLLETITPNTYGGIQITPTDAMWLTLGSTNQFFLKNTAQDVNVFTASDDGAFSDANGWLIGTHFDSGGQPINMGLRMIPLHFTITALGAGATTAEQSFYFASSNTDGYSGANMLAVPKNIIGIMTGIECATSSLITVNTYLYSKYGFQWKATNSDTASRTFTVRFLVIAW